MSRVVTERTETGGNFLTADQLRRFERDGYLLVKGVLDPAESIDPLIAEYEGVLDRLAHDLHQTGGDRLDVRRTELQRPYGSHLPGDGA